MSNRQRGVVLTDRGQERLEAAIAAAQDAEKFGKRFTQAELSERTSLSIKTLKKIRQRTAPVDGASVRIIFAAFGLELETTDYELLENLKNFHLKKHLTLKIDWGGKPDTAIFFGRAEELATLDQWLMTDQCRVVTLLGMGGIGKTALAAKIADQIVDQFDYVIWRSLREAPPLDKILAELIQFLSEQQQTETNRPNRSEEQIIRLLDHLREHRCLLVLDNLEAILQAESAGHFRDGYEGYGELIRQLGEAQHQSCLLLTSRECPRELAPMAGDRLPVRLLSVTGIDPDAGREILKSKGLALEKTDIRSQELIRRYSGNPQALSLVATSIQREFLGDVDDFLEEEGAAVEDVHSLLDQHLTRLAPLERSILFWLAINSEPVGLDELMEDLLPPVTKREIRSALRGLRDRYLIETVGKQFTLQNVVTGFLLERFNNDELANYFDISKTASVLESTFNSRSSKSLTYRIWPTLEGNTAILGEEIPVSLHLDTDVENATGNYCLLEIQQEEFCYGEISISFKVSGLKVEGTNFASFPLGLHLIAQNDFQVANFRLTPLRAGPSKIVFELYIDNKPKVVVEENLEIVGPGQEISSTSDNQFKPRPAPQPDLILQIQTGWNESLTRCSFYYCLDSFHPRLTFATEIQQQSETFSAKWLGQTRRFLQAILEEVGSGLPEDSRSRLTSLGKHLFQQLLPQELQTTFRSIIRFNVPFTLLILADQDAEFPWELLHDGQSFWGERFIIGRWPLELEKTRPYEFAIGAVNLAHYENVEQTEQWSGLLEPSGAPPPMVLSGGMLGDLGSVEVMRGLHLLRRGTSPEEMERQDAPVPLESNGSEDLEQSLRPAKLSLRRNRPLVTLGYLNAGVPELTTLEQTWAPTFIRSGCSTFVGPLWAVQPVVETAFASSFYHRLWAGESLGMAFQAGRRAAKAVTPDSLDWMAYVLYGDPMARPYRPTVGKGYAVVEPIGQEITDRVTPGSSVRFRVSLRRTPPVWYSDRLMDVAEDLAFEDLWVYIVASGLQVTPGDSIDMQRSPSGDYLGWFTLTVPSNFEDDSALVRIHYEDGDDPVHSLRFALLVGTEEVERP